MFRIRGRARGARRRGVLAGFAIVGLIGVSLAPATAEPDAATGERTSDRVSSLPSGRTEFRTLDEYERAMSRLARRHPRRVRKFALPYETTGGRTVYGIEISQQVNRSDGKPVFVDVGAHHGDEWPSAELTMEFAYYLATHRNDPYVKDALQRTRVVIVPVVNPDGLVKDTRRTAAGVDMNRNYGFGWMPGDDGTHGSKAWSEPETKNIRWLVATRQATVFNTQHTCIQEVLYPPLQQEVGDAQDVGRLHALAGAMAGEFGPTYHAGASADDYETTGEAIGWSYYATRGLATTTETCPADPPEGHDFDSEVIDTFDRNLAAMMEALEAAGDPREHSTIVGKAPVGATLTVRKSFPMYTGSYEHDDGTVRPDKFQQTLRSSMKVRRKSGMFAMSVNPSYRPVPPYQSDGTHGGLKGFLTEPWLLTCRSRHGRSSARVNVNVGETVSRVLSRCGELPRHDRSSAYVQSSIDSPAEPDDREPTLRVDVTSPGHVVRGGIVTVRVDGRAVDRIRLKGGSSQVSLGELESGAHEVVVSYHGTEDIREASTTRTFTVE